MHVLDAMVVLMIIIVLLIVIIGVHGAILVLGVHLDFLVHAHYVLEVIMAVLVITVIIHAINFKQSLQLLLEVRAVMGKLCIHQPAPLKAVLLATVAVSVMHATEYVQAVLAVMFAMTDVTLMIKLVLYRLLLF